ncbi:MAG: redox-sensing transcriptional repressor Rex [Candidatus Eremiobacteraeota bacterium]|nr:redox-sensing transcriptional repressor Rex [Candidatus Eremiobacteraeota bacterium]
MFDSLAQTAAVLEGTKSGRTGFADVSIPRLFAYHRALSEAHTGGKTVITSHGLAAALGHTIASTQIRKDLSAIGGLGRRGQGYAIKPLVSHLALVLGLERDWRIAIVGFGYLGHAFATFVTAREKRFQVKAIFDIAPSVIGTVWQGVDVCHADRIEDVLHDARCDIGVVAVPAAAAQSTAERLCSLGVRAILNFAPSSLQLHGPTIVRNIDLAGELSILTHRLCFEAGT